MCDVRLMVDRRSVCGAVPAPRRASVTTRDGTTARAIERMTTLDDVDALDAVAVSYTHLTLPTILLV